MSVMSESNKVRESESSDVNHLLTLDLFHSSENIVAVSWGITKWWSAQKPKLT